MTQSGGIGCIGLDPGIVEELLDAARSPSGAWKLSREQLWHLDRCDACRIAVERGRRLAAVHRSLEPSATEVVAARGRFAAHRERRRRPIRAGLLWPRAITVGLCLAAVATAAAQVVIQRRDRAIEAAAARAKAPAAPMKHRRHRLGALASAPAFEPLEEALQGTPDVDPPVVPPVLPPVVPPVLPPVVPPESAPGVETAPAAATRTSPGAITGQRSEPRRAHRRAPAIGLASPAPREPAAPAASWQEAATALRSDDSVAAIRALSALAGSADARARDAARLARAQLWLSQGKRARAGADLEDLAAAGATPLIRARAKEGLAAIAAAPHEGAR